MKSMGPVTELLKTKTLNDNPYIDADWREQLSLMDRHRCSRNGPARHLMLSRTNFVCSDLFYCHTDCVYCWFKWYNAE